MKTTTTLALLGTLAAFTASGAALAEVSGTDWEVAAGGKVRLVRASAPEADGSFLAGLQFKMEPGWHIYWRYPGEAGVPTEVDFSGSTNLESAELLFPAPQTYSDGFSRSIVYKDEVVLPIRLKRANDSRPTILNANVDFGICEKVCVPASVELSTLLPARSAKKSEIDELFYEAIAKVPQRLPHAKPTTNVDVKTVDGKQVLAITAPVSGSASEPSLYVEAGPMSYHGVPKLTKHENGQATWELPVNGLQAKGDALPLTLTLVLDDEAIEETVTLPYPVE